MRVKGFILYRIYYEGPKGNFTVYVGRTKQPLQDRIRGHLFAKPMHRSIDIKLVTRIEYAELKTEADMNLYEIYYILKDKPPLNVDDKARDSLTVSLPDLEWLEFKTPLWGKWVEALDTKATERDRMRRRLQDLPQEMAVLRSRFKMKEISEAEFWDQKEALMAESKELSKRLYG